MSDSGSLPSKQGRVKHVWGLALIAISVSVSLVLLIIDTENSSQPDSLIGGITYSQSSSQGVSAEDQSPEISPKFLREERESVKKMKKMKLALKKSLAEDAKIETKIKDFRFQFYASFAFDNCDEYILICVNQGLGQAIHRRDRHPYPTYQYQEDRRNRR